MPKGVTHFGVYKDIWVVEWQYVLPLTAALRQQLVTVEHLRNSLK